MRIFLLLSLLYLMAFSQLAAQNQDSVAIKKYYEENAILWLGWTKYIKNNQTFPLKNLEKEIIFSPDAIHEFSKYRRYRTYLTISAIVGGGLYLSALVAKDREVKLGMFAGSLVALSFSVSFSFDTSKHLNRAIWFHNRDILLR